METISLICTVRDEADNIATLLDSMLAQSRMPDEIVINDCGSRDETAAIVLSYAERDSRIRLVCGGFNISSGRNNAVAATSGTLIASTDAGLTLHPDWLAHIITPLEAGQADQVGGFFHPEPQSIFELALAWTNYRFAEEIIPETFMPFGKSMAFRKIVWEQVGGFPEWLDHCEDLIFDMAVEQAGYRRVFAPQAVVFFRPRSNLRAFARQYFYYARGDGMAGILTLRHAIRYATYVALLALLTLALRFPSLRGVIVFMLLVGIAFYTRTPYRRLWQKTQHLPLHQRLYALSLVPIIRFVGDCGKMAGYPVGVFKRKAESGKRET